MIIRRATQDDRPAIVALRRERAAWLARRGTDQWQVGLGTDGFDARVKDSIDAGETWVATEDNQVIGTIAVDQWTNPGLWSEAELADALVIHRMITRLSAPPAIGTALLEHADQLAAAAGKRWLRLDAWTSNKGLHRYWESRGFRHVRTVDGHVSRSTALFERPVSSTHISAGEVASDSDNLEQRFNEHRTRLAAAREAVQGGPPHIDAKYRALADEHRCGAQLYDEAAPHVDSELLRTALRHAAQRARGLACSYEEQADPTRRTLAIHQDC